MQQIRPEQKCIEIRNVLFFNNVVKYQQNKHLHNVFSRILHIFLQGYAKKKQFLTQNSTFAITAFCTKIWL